MTESELVTLTTYRTAPEAAIAQGALTTHGVPAYLANAETATMLPHLGMAVAVRLQVAAGDVDRAADILRAIVLGDASESAAPWTCPNCGANVDTGFDACWSCGAIHDATSDAPAP